jgi:primosomal protein N''
VIVALITGGVTLIGSVIAVLATSSKTQQEIRIHQAVTDEKIEQLREEIRQHNNFARRMPVVEEQIKVANHRIDDLEKKSLKIS